MSDEINLSVMATKAVISDHRGLVCITLDKAADGIQLSPEDARVMAEALSRQAYRAHYGDYPTTTDRSSITESLRIRCRNRVEQMLRSFDSDANPPPYQQRATAIIDHIFKTLA